jgi:hypothetical protein
MVRLVIGRGGRCLGLVILIALIFSGARPARADAPATASRELDAKTACLSGHLETGIALLARLFAETNDPTYIYNQARCFEQNGRASEAITRFREYLRKSPGIAADEKTQVQAHIGEMEQQSRVAPPPAAIPVAPPAATTPELPGPSAAGGPPSAPPDDQTRAHTRAFRIAGIVTASVGVAALGGGLYMGLRAQSLSKEVTADANEGIYSRSKYDKGSRAETWQWVGYGVGAAALLGGSLLYYLGSRSKVDESQPKVGVARTRPSSIALVSDVGHDGFVASIRTVF